VLLQKIDGDVGPAALIADLAGRRADAVSSQSVFSS
jgi:hypothetical protein